MISIDRLPVILGTFAGLFTGFIGISTDVPVKNVYLWMVIFIIIFMAAGIVLRNILNNIIDEQYKKEMEEELKRKQEEELKKKEEEVQNAQSDDVADIQSTTESHQIDFAVDDEFTPLDLSEAIKTKMQQ